MSYLTQPPAVWSTTSRLTTNEVDAVNISHPACSETRSAGSRAMNRYAEGEESAFAEVYDELAPALHRYLRRIVRSESIAEDLLQQTFLNMHRARGRFIGGSRVEPWAYAIAHSCALTWLRREGSRKTEASASEDTPSEATAENDVRATELWKKMARELDKISPKLRESFLLVRLEGLTHAEAAYVLGIPASTVKLRAHRATLRLRMRFTRSGEREAPR